MMSNDRDGRSPLRIGDDTGRKIVFCLWMNLRILFPWSALVSSCSPRGVLECLAALMLLMMTGCVSMGPLACRDARTMGKLVVARLDWMDEVAMVKQVRSLPVTDAPREAELLVAMEKRGVTAGIPAAAVRAFFAGQITAAKVVQVEWIQAHPDGMRECVLMPDLAKTVRPALDEISGKMIACLARLRTSGMSVDDVVNDAERRMQRAEYSEKVRAAVVKGLRGGMER